MKAYTQNCFWELGRFDNCTSYNLGDLTNLSLVSLELPSAKPGYSQEWCGSAVEPTPSWDTGSYEHSLKDSRLPCWIQIHPYAYMRSLSASEEISEVCYVCNVCCITLLPNFVVHFSNLRQTSFWNKQPTRNLCAHWIPGNCRVWQND